MSGIEFMVLGERSFRRLIALVAGGESTGVTEDRVLVRKISNLTWWGRSPVASGGDVTNLTWWIQTDTTRIDASVFARDKVEALEIAGKITGRMHSHSYVHAL